MNKNIFFSLSALLLIPAAMAADWQLALLKKLAAASFGYWPYWWFTPLAHLIVAAGILVVFRALRPPRKIILGFRFTAHRVIRHLLLAFGCCNSLAFPPAFPVVRVRRVDADGWGIYRRYGNFSVV